MKNLCEGKSRIRERIEENAKRREVKELFKSKEEIRTEFKKRIIAARERNHDEFRKRIQAHKEEIIRNKF